MNDFKTDLLLTMVSTDTTRFNALQHGVLSRYTVLPWEDEQEYLAVVSDLVTEHAPQGPTEVHLVEEIAGIIWRKRRLRLAEAATHRRGLEDTLKPFRETVKIALVHLNTAEQSERVCDVIRATPSDTELDIRGMNDDEAQTHQALHILSSKRTDAYEAALVTLNKDTQVWWSDYLTQETEELEDGDEPASPDRSGLRKFIEEEVLPWYENRKKEFANRPLIRDQAFGDSLQINKLERLGRYEVHLDRKLERMLSMLLRLKEMRLGKMVG